MNNDRRKQIDAVKDKLEDIKGEIEAIASDERDYYDNMPESFQSGEKGERANEAATALEEIDSDIDEIISKLDDAVQ